MSGKTERDVTATVVGAVVLIAVATLAGLAILTPAEEAEAKRSDLYHRTITIDGRNVPCVVAETAQGVAISCDWSAR